MAMFRGMTPDELHAELLRIGTLRRQLRAPYLIFERACPTCNGECESPKAIATIQGVQLVCCHVFPGHQRFVDATRLRRKLLEVGARLTPKSPLKERVSGLTLTSRYSRDFTGTAAMRRFKVTCQ